MLEIDGNIWWVIAALGFTGSVESETFYGDFMVKLIWNMSGNLIYYVLKTQSNV